MSGYDARPEGLSFEHDLKPLFRERDRDSMLAKVDPWKREPASINFWIGKSIS
jgi:hypothetical protein